MESCCFWFILRDFLGDVVVDREGLLGGELSDRVGGGRGVSIVSHAGGDGGF